MKYDFDVIIDRSNNNSCKYDELHKVFGTADVIPLWVADMDFKTAQPIIDAAEKKAKQGLWGYVSRPDSYFEAVRDWQERRNGWRPDTALMSWAPGVVPAMSALVRTMTNEGDGVLIQPPVYSEFAYIIKSAGRRAVESRVTEKDGRWNIDFADFEEKLKNARLFLLCSPHNPLGRIWKREELERMMDLCVKYKVPVVSDEIHSDLVFWGNKHINTAALSPEAAANTITCLSATKTFNLAGLQASTTVFPNKELKEKFDDFWYAMDIGRNNAFSVTTMEAAFRHGDEWLDQLKKYLEDNFLFIRDYCEKYIPKIKPNVPDATYLVWLDCRRLGLNNDKLREFMIKKAGLGLNEGRAYDRSLEGYMRLNAACPRSILQKAMENLRAAADSL